MRAKPSFTVPTAVNVLRFSPPNWALGKAPTDNYTVDFIQTPFGQSIMTIGQQRIPYQWMKNMKTVEYQWTTIPSIKGSRLSTSVVPQFALEELYKRKTTWEVFVKNKTCLVKVNKLGVVFDVDMDGNFASNPTQVITLP